MPFRQILVVLLALGAILGAAAFILSWEGDGDETATSDTTTSTTASTSTTTLAPTTTSIPIACDTQAAEADTTSSTEPTVPDSTVPDSTVPETTVTEAPLVPTLGARSSLSTVGLDEVTFGLTVNQARAAAGTEFAPCEPVSDCYRVTPVAAPTGITFVVDEGTIERVDISGNSPITTVSGAGIGTTDEELTELFGDALERTELGGGAVDVVFVPSSENDAEFRVIFTVVDGEVQTMRSGRIPLVLESEPCA